MKNTILVGLLAVPLMVFTLGQTARAADSSATTTCKDGTTSTATGRGACSGHGGVQKAATTAAGAAAPAATAAPAAAAKAAPAAAKSSTASKSAPTTRTAGGIDPPGATAKCKDGTYSKSQHRAGTCSSHGGVAEWLTAK
jgi:Protein of unknown function (DUF3761)